MTMTNIVTTLFLLTIALSAPSLSFGKHLQGNRNAAGRASQEEYVDLAREFNREEMRFLQMSSSMGTDPNNGAPVVTRVDTPAPSMVPSTAAPTGSSAPTASAVPSTATPDPTPAPTASPTGGTAPAAETTDAPGSGPTPTEAPNAGPSLQDLGSSATTSTVSTFAALLAVMTLHFL